MSKGIDIYEGKDSNKMIKRDNLRVRR